MAQIPRAILPAKAMATSMRGFRDNMRASHVPSAAPYLVGSSPIFRVHIFMGLTIFLLFPFTRLVHMLSAPVRYLWRPGYQVVRSRKLAS